MDPLIPSLGKIINKIIITAGSQSALERVSRIKVNALDKTQG